MGLLIPRNPFAYPGSTPASYNRNHIAASPQMRYAGVAQGTTFRDLRTGAKATIVGTAPTYVVDGYMGPSISATAGGSASLTVSGGIAETPTNITIAGICSNLDTTASTSHALFCAQPNGTNTIPSFQVSGNSCSFRGTGGTGVIGVPGLVVDHPTFVAMSVGQTSYSFVSVDLVTGSLKTSSGSNGSVIPSATGSSYTIASTGFFGSSPFDGNIATLMYSVAYLPLPLLMQWAQAPWDFWYPPTVQQIIFNAISAPPPPPQVLETVTLADTVSAGVIYTVTVSESVSLSDTPSSGAIYAAAVAESMTFADTAGPVSYNVTLTESISLVDTVNATRVHNAAVAETITFTDQSDSIWYPLIVLFEEDCVVSHTTDGKPSQPAVKFTRIDPTALPREVEIQYSDLDEDYAVIPQSARQLYGRIKGGVPEVYAAASATQKMSVTSAFGIRANEAITLAYDMLYRLWTQTVQIEFEHSNLRFEAGDVFVLIGSFGQVIGRIDEAVWTKSRTNQIKATALSAVGPPLEADSGFPGLTPSSSTSGNPGVGIGTVKSQGPNLVGGQDEKPHIAVTFAGGSG